jgi:omega-6 fatty acid desaturase (delta-12 desaturase)
MSALSSVSERKTSRPDWYQDVVAYQQPDLGKAIWQIVNTFVPYVLLWVAMVWSVQREIPYWLTLVLAVPAAGFLVRIFIIFHDCGHQSFFASRRANTIMGYVTGVLTFAPYEYWRYNHGVHHATVGDLDRRGTGDVYIMTVQEYRAAPLWKRVAYRLYRHPLVLFGLGPVFIFLISYRFFLPKAKRSHRYSVLVTNLALVAIVITASLTIGLRTYVLIQLPVILLADLAGIWLFYVQHHFAGVYWARHDVWDSWQAALKGSSYYRLPAVLQWFSGNIGLHHIHHVRPRIPNYALQRCYDAVPAMQAVKPLTVIKSLEALRFRLYDESQKQLVGFRAARAQN